MSEASEVARSLRRATLRLARSLRRERPDAARPSSQVSVLASLRDGEHTARQLADLERIQPQTLSRTLAALERDDLIYRRTDAYDRRRAWLGLTSAGLAVLSEDMAGRDAWLAERLEGLSPAELAVLALAAELVERLAARD
jgi:DNA-binding MarR family transcriptional regulator